MIGERFVFRPLTIVSEAHALKDERGGEESIRRIVAPTDTTPKMARLTESFGGLKGAFADFEPRKRDRPALGILHIATIPAGASMS